MREYSLKLLLKTFFNKERKMEENKDNLIKVSESNNLFFEEVSEDCLCEFLECEDKAILHVEDFNVCYKHGIKLVHCFVDKLNGEN
jgi:hypothetical protein